ncbi:lipopolysaccharide heptosyltransferase I [soil metagenome]
MSRSTATILELQRLCPERVCLVKPSSLGDIVHALPVLSAIRELWPSATISWVVNRGLRSLVEGHPDLDEAIPFDRSSARFSASGISSIGQFLNGLRRKRFDLVVDLQGLLRSSLIARATGAPVRIGLAEAREGATRFYTHCIASKASHAVDRMLAVAEALGADVSRPRFQVAWTEEDRAWARTTLARMPRPLLVLNIGARWETKRWPPKQFAEVARRASSTFGAGLVVVGAPEDRPLVAELRRHLGALDWLDLCGQTTLPRLAAVSAEADLFLSNDTGPLHLAAAAGAKVIGLYTCTDPARTGPYGEQAIALTTKVWCASSRVKCCDRLDCMAELSPERVWPVVEARLGALNARTRTA